jgi:Skp family chaperone for outer membrane proteins
MVSSSGIGADEGKSPSLCKTVKIGTVDVARVYDNFPKAKETKKAFEGMVKDYETEVAAMMKEGEGLIKQINEMREKLSAPATDEGTKEDLERKLTGLFGQLREKQDNIERFRISSEDKLEQQQKEVFAAHFDEIQKCTGEVGRKEDFDVILNASGGNVIYSKPEYDVTDKVSTLLNQSSPKSVDKAGKKQ